MPQAGRGLPKRIAPCGTQPPRVSLRHIPGASGPAGPATMAAMATPANDDPVEYPREFERDVTLQDATRVHLHPIRPDDAPRLSEFHDRLSRDTAYHRFFTVMKHLPSDSARTLAAVDYRRRFAIVAEQRGERGPELVGVGRYEPTDKPETVEVAFVVQDGWQDRGLGTILFNDVLRAAAERGIRRFRAYTLADNRRMLDLISRFGHVKERKLEQGVLEILFTRREPIDSFPVVQAAQSRRRLSWGTTPHVGRVIRSAAAPRGTGCSRDESHRGRGPGGDSSHAGASARKPPRARWPRTPRAGGARTGEGSCRGCP